GDEIKRIFTLYQDIVYNFNTPPLPQGDEIKRIFTLYQDIVNNFNIPLPHPPPQDDEIKRIFTLYQDIGDEIKRIFTLYHIVNNFNIPPPSPPIPRGDEIKRIFTLYQDIGDEIKRIFTLYQDIGDEIKRIFTLYQDIVNNFNIPLPHPHPQGDEIKRIFTLYQDIGDEIKRIFTLYQDIVNNFNIPPTPQGDEIKRIFTLYQDIGDEIKRIFTLYQDIACNFTVLTLLPYNGTMDASQYSRLDYALASDALRLVTESYMLVDETAAARNLTLNDENVKFYMNKTIDNNSAIGHTGILQFDSDGKRNNVSFALTSVTGTDSYPRGHWYSVPYILDRHIKFYDEKHPLNRSTPFPLRGRRAKVVMIEERPFTMLKRDHMLKRGNDRFEGFAVDLIEEVAKMLEFDYDIYLVNDGKFGSKMPNGEWNGMIGELLAGNATMSVAPLSINAQREEAVDFTKPFKTRYISVLMKIPTRETSYFEFLNPLSPIVWICTLCAFVIVSVILYALERVGRSKSRSPDSLEITVRESFWFIFGSLLQGNTDSTPSTIPGRILTSAWWFFALILISSYTANLAAFLTVKKINTPIKSVTDLAQQTKIKYGTVKDSGIMSFFKNTNIEHFSKMWSQMSEIDPDSMVENTLEGYKKVKNGNYAFFWDTTVNRYQAIIDCEVMEIGPPFDPKGFGIGVPPGATYREELSMAILRLSDKGRLHELETKWWDSGTCPDLTKASTDETASLQIENVAGVFFILVGGIIIAAIVCLGEYFANAMIRASKQASKKRKETNQNGLEAPAFL
ncbi:glutamate receptor 3-like, partial [Physella acuta]|uniref:glutamate receptor 3-like n=1 Tax=Physella acuta TaxID=109671 RepID=UPI0027DBE42D